MMMMVIVSVLRGISSTVRRVIEKTTQKAYAVKIIDISGERADNPSTIEQTKMDTIREVNILRMCAGHPNISELAFCFVSLFVC